MAKSNLMQAPKQKLVDAVERMGASIKRNKDQIKEKTEDTMGVVLAAGGAGAVGWYMGGLSADIEQDATLDTVEKKEEAMKIMGYVDRDLAAGAVLTLLGLSGMGGKKTSGAMTALGTGMLSYYAGSKAFDSARERGYGDNAGGAAAFPRGA